MINFSKIHASCLFDLISFFEKEVRRVMTSKMKGLFKGLRYISQIFDFGEDEEKEEEMQIGLPTDVKHVAHIGSDAPSVEPPSWMKEFKQAHESSATLDPGPGGASADYDSSHVKRGGKKDVPEARGVPRSSRRSSNGQLDSTSSSSDQPAGTTSKKDAASTATRSRKSRRNPSKDMSSASTSVVEAPGVGVGDSPSRDIPTARKTTATRKKTRDAAARSRSNSTFKPNSASSSAAASSASAAADDGIV